MTRHRFAVGDTVRESNGALVGKAEQGGLGRVVEHADGGYCSIHDEYDPDCPGPWYVVAFDAYDCEPLNYAEHELMGADA